MNILLVAATLPEIAPTIDWLNQYYTPVNDLEYRKEETTIRVVITGIGQMATAWSLGVVLGSYEADLAINMGIAGALDRRLNLGDVVHIVSERFGDLGIENADGSFVTFQETGMVANDQFPFKNGVLNDNYAEGIHFLPKVAGITVNKVHGYAPSIAAFQQKFPDAQVESMEGAAFFYACLMSETPFLQIRAISNYVETRNRAHWKIKEAIDALNSVAQQMLEEGLI